MYYFSIKKYSSKQNYVYKDISSAALNSLASLLNNFTLPVPKNPKLVNYDYLEGFTNFTTSISHTKNYHAAIIASKKKIISIGIDIELINRKPKNNIIERISHPKDFYTNNLEHWTQKEASFKALSPLHKDILVLNHFWVNNNCFGIDDIKLGEVKNQEVIVEGQKIIMSIAVYLRN